MSKKSMKKNPIQIEKRLDLDQKLSRAVSVLKKPGLEAAFVARFESIPLDFKLYAYNHITMADEAIANDKKDMYIRVYLNVGLWNSLDETTTNDLKNAVLKRKENRNSETEKEVRRAKEYHHSQLTPFMFFHRIGDVMLDTDIYTYMPKVFGYTTVEELEENHPGLWEDHIYPIMNILSKKPYQKYINTAAGRSRKLINLQQTLSDLFALSIIAPNQSFFTPDAPQKVKEMEPWLRIYAAAMKEVMLGIRVFFI